MSVQYDPNTPATNEWLDWFSLPSMAPWDESQTSEQMAINNLQSGYTVPQPITTMPGNWTYNAQTNTVSFPSVNRDGSKGVMIALMVIGGLFLIQGRN